MRRRFLTCLSSLSIVFMLTLIIIYIPLALSPNKSEIIDSLDELYKYVSSNTSLPNDAFENQNNGSIEGKRRALSNKVNAVIHQIKSGAYHGALNKLTNDIEKKAEEWLVPPWETELKGKIRDIIDLVKGIVPPGFSMTASPDTLTIEQNSSDTSVITVTSWNNFCEPVDLTATLFPPVAKISATLDPVQVTPPANGYITSTLTVGVAADAEPDDYKIIVTGTSDALEYSVEISLEVTSLPPVPPVPDFSIHVFPTNLTIQQGSSDAAIIIITSLKGFDQSVDLAVTSEPIAGVTRVLDPYQVTPLAGEPATSMLTVEVAENVVPDTYTMKVTGMSNTLQHSANLTLTVVTPPAPPDLEPPTVRMVEPTNQSYLAGQVNIVVFMYDENFKTANLTIDHKLLASWTSTGEHSILWNTTTPEYPDATYNITLKAKDEAGHIGEVTITVTVDNTLPAANIDAPVDGSYLRSSVLVRVTGDDANFYMMNLKIDDESVKEWKTSGSQIHKWNTLDYSDDTHSVTLAVYDRAGNNKELSITTTIDNTPPMIEAPTWKPEEPSINEQVNVTVKVSDSQPGSGIQNVTLWYWNKTISDLQPLTMSLNVTSGNWTAMVPAQSKQITIEFYIEAFDNAGNKAVTDEYEYIIITPAGIPLAWIIVIVFLILAATTAVLYFWRKHRIEKRGISSRV